MGTSPNKFNPLWGSNRLLTELLYSSGTVVHPWTGQFTPWAFRDWRLNAKNVGTASPTLVGTLRDDLTFSDGTPVSAEDAKFTAEFITEQRVTGSIAASQFDRVEAIHVDTPKGRTVNYFFEEADAGWFTDVLGQILLPKHVWEDVTDYQQYTPRETVEGIVGSGPFTVRAFNMGNWIELERRPDDEIWQTDATYVDWFHEEAPFIDGVRIQFFGTDDETRRAVRSGDIDASLKSVPLDDAVSATNDDRLVVKSSPTAGWHHHSYNTRRVPLDDPVFRRFLVLTVDKTWIVEALNGGISARQGSYATTDLYDEWRPPEPDDQDKYRGVRTPSLAFPGEAGTFEVGPDAIDSARSYLEESIDSTHDYSWIGIEDKYANSPDGKVLHVNGTVFNEAHTDNSGEPNGGPLVVSFNPPQEDLDEARIAQQWIETLRKIGVPVVPEIESLNSQLSRVLGAEDFDVFAGNWTNIPTDHTHFKQLFGRWGADIDGDRDVLMLNPMGYTGADQLIEEQRSVMNVEQRKPLVKELLATIWNDAPTNILKHDVRLQPVNRRWTGWIETPAFGVLNVNTFLNLRWRIGPRETP